MTKNNVSDQVDELKASLAALKKQTKNLDENEKIDKPKTASKKTKNKEKPKKPKKPIAQNPKTKPKQPTQKSVTSQKPKQPTQKPKKPTPQKPKQSTQKPKQSTQKPKSISQKPKPTPQKPKQSPQKPKSTPQKPKSTPQKPTKTVEKPKEKKKTKKQLEEEARKEKEERERTYEEELEKQLSEEEIENFQIEKVDMERLTNKVCEMLAPYESEGMVQNELWKKLKLTGRNGSRLGLKLERTGYINREKILEKGRWTYKLILKKTPISTLSIENSPCLICPVEQKCSIEGEISPRTCQLIEEWVTVDAKKPKKAK